MHKDLKNREQSKVKELEKLRDENERIIKEFTTMKSTVQTNMKELVESDKHLKEKQNELELETEVAEGLKFLIKAGLSGKQEEEMEENKRVYNTGQEATDGKISFEKFMSIMQTIKVGWILVRMKKSSVEDLNITSIKRITDN